MKKQISLSLCFLGTTLPALCNSQELFKFDDFRVEVLKETKLKGVDFKSHPHGEILQQKWEGFESELFGKEVTFAGRYHILTGGCGTMCQVYYAIDIDTGKILDSVTTSLGACYQEDSLLFISNPDLSLAGEPLPKWASTTYYKFDGKKFIEIKSTKTSFKGKCKYGQ